MAGLDKISKNTTKMPVSLGGMTPGTLINPSEGGKTVGKSRLGSSRLPRSQSDSPAMGRHENEDVYVIETRGVAPDGRGLTATHEVTFPRDTKDIEVQAFYKKDYEER